MLADNNSTDRTAELAEATAKRLGARLPAYASNPRPASTTRSTRRSSSVTTPLVVTVDADTLLHRDALTYLIARVTSRPQDQHVCACAGALVAANAERNFLTRMQGWDYRLGINGVKRIQAAYNSALVAQGAFSAYWTDDIRAVGGWPDAIGEDIVLTWTLMDSRGLVQYEPCALAATLVPREVRHFMRQRSRWARGMFEGIGSTRRTASRGCWRSSSPGSTTSCRFWTSGTCSSGFPALSSSFRLSADLLVVVHAGNPDHPGRLRTAASLAGAERLPPPRRPSEPDTAASSATCSPTRH